MRKLFKITPLLLLFAACNVTTEDYPLIYTDEEPNEEFVKRLKMVLEDSYNVNIRLVKAQNAQSIIDSLESSTLDMGIVENLVNVGDGINTVVPVFTKALHLFYKENLNISSIEELLLDRSIYIGVEGTAAYSFMMDLFEFYRLDMSRLKVNTEMEKSDVIAVFSVIMSEEQLQAFKGYKLFSFSSPEQVGSMGTEVDGIALKFPRVKPYIIPKKTYGILMEAAAVTIATDMVFVVREGMGETAVLDLTKSIFAHRDQFIHLNPAFYFGIIEDFDRSKLSHPLHEGARDFLDRDEPSFLERYAEIAGVLLAVLIAMSSGLVSFSRWRKQNKKDKVDVCYAHLMKIKNEMPTIRSVDIARQKIQEVKDQQDQAFKMLINEELAANESFRIYMELSKETIQDIRIRLGLLKKSSA